MNLILSICDKSYFVHILYIFKVFFKLICYIVPPLIIITSSVNLYKSVHSGKSDDLKEGMKQLSKKIIAGLVVMILPTLIAYLINNLAGFNDIDLFKCIDAASMERVESLRQAEQLEEEQKRKQEEKEYEAKIKEKNEKLKEENNKKSENTGSSDSGSSSNGLRVTHLNYIAQGNYPNLPFCANGSTVANSGCGAAAFAMIASSYSDSKYNMEYVASWFCQNLYSLSNGALSNEAALHPTALSHFGLSGGLIFGGNGYSGTQYSEANGSAILSAVQSGKSVMIGIPRHWIVAGPHESCSSTQIYLYDSGFPSRNGCYTPYELFQLTYNSRNHCTKEGICGWDIGIALG